MSKPDALTKEEIEEELINNDLMNSGGVENQDLLQQMQLEEKANLLKGIKQSKDNFENSSRFSQSILDNSSSNFPSLPAVGKNNTKHKLKLPRKFSSKTSDSEDSSDKCINILDDEEPVITKFILPFCVDDGAPPLLLPEKQLKKIKNPFYVMKHESPSVALKRMLAQHDAWKAAYTAETRRLESNALSGDIEDSDSKEQNGSPKTLKTEEKEDDPYRFTSSSPVVSKVYNGPRKRETIKSDNISQQSGRQLQRKTSRDSDCEEVETINKPEKPKIGDWISPSTTRSKSKRNRKQLLNQEKVQTYENTPDVEFDFENKWEPQSATWQGSHSPSSSSLNNQVQPRRSLSSVTVVEEAKVQCPICQRNFALSKVENHAATCEGFSGSPMDIEEEQD